jgi:hypothetical protein
MDSLRDTPQLLFGDALRTLTIFGKKEFLLDSGANFVNSDLRAESGSAGRVLLTSHSCAAFFSRHFLIANSPAAREYRIDVSWIKEVPGAS